MLAKYYHGIMSTEPYIYTEGRLPLLVSMPHTATGLPDGMLSRFTPAAHALRDTDWHIDRLYDFAHGLGAHTIKPIYSRYVVDLNRAPDNSSLYPGKFTTGLCPLTLFDGTPIYKAGMEPDDREIRERTKLYWQPYHDKIQATLNTLKAKHGKVILFDAHSICSVVPTLFEGQLPDLNFGTADGKTASDELMEKLIASAKKSPYSAVHNGRFKGGYITRHYGLAGSGVESIQLELAQKNYMQETPPFTYNEAKAGQLQAVLRDILSIIMS